MIDQDLDVAGAPALDEGERRLVSVSIGDIVESVKHTDAVEHRQGRPDHTLSQFDDHALHDRRSIAAGASVW